MTKSSFTCFLGHFIIPPRSWSFSLKVTIEIVKIQINYVKLCLADSHIVSSAHGKLVQIAEQMKMLQKQAEDVLKKAKEDQMLAHAACNFEKKPGQIYHL